MNFRPELAERVMEGSKTCTRRLASTNPRSPWWSGGCAYRVGQRVAVCPGRGKHAIGHATVTSVARMKLGHMSDAEAQAEGFLSVADFEQVFAALNGGYDSAAVVWRVGLEAVR